MASADHDLFGSFPFLPSALRLDVADLGDCRFWAGSGCATTDGQRLVSARACRFQLHGYVAEVREETRAEDAAPALFVALTAMDPGRGPYLIDGFRQGSTFRISLQEARRARRVATVWGTASSPAWQAPALTVTEGRTLNPDEAQRVGVLLEQAATLAYSVGRWHDTREGTPGLIALRLP